MDNRGWHLEIDSSPLGFKGMNQDLQTPYYPRGSQRLVPLTTGRWLRERFCEGHEVSFKGEGVEENEI